MVGRVSANARYQSLRHSQRVLERMAPLVRFGLFAIGVSGFLDQVKGLVSDAQFTWGARQVMGAVALVTIGGLAVAGRSLKAAADLIEVLIAGAESAGPTAESPWPSSPSYRAGQRRAKQARDADRQRGAVTIRLPIGRWCSRTEFTHGCRWKCTPAFERFRFHPGRSGREQRRRD
jgi:hypothetical protein